MLHSRFYLSCYLVDNSFCAGLDSLVFE
uniref:Uncharacterized protein n=1 Tax=Rhizophora mucronata TaxID=61149 RepID=A0A2P2IST2_RHIMU